MPIPWRILAGGGAFGAIGNLVQLAILVLAYRLWLSLHGAEATDRWLVLVAIANLGALADVGVASAAVQRMASLPGDERAAWRRCSARFLVAAGSVGGAIAAITAGCWLFGRLPLTEASVVAVATGAISAGLIWSTYQAGLLKAELRFGAAAAVLAGQQAAVFLVPCATGGGTVAYMSAATAALALLIALVQVRVGRSSRPVSSGAGPSWSTLVRAGLPYAAQGGLAFFFGHFQRLAISAIAGPGDIAALAAAQSILGKAQGLVGAAGEALNPAVARGLVAPSIYWRALGLSAVICLAGFAAIVVIALVCLPYWLPGSAGEGAQRIIPLLSFGYAAAAATAVVVHILNGLGRPWGNALCGAIAAFCAGLILVIGRILGGDALLVAAGAVTVSYVVYAGAMVWHGARVVRRMGSRP